MPRSEPSPLDLDRNPLPGLELAAPDIFSEAVIDELPLGVVVLDQTGSVVKYNRFEERLAGRRRQDVIGRSFFGDVAVCTNVERIAGRFRTHIASNDLNENLEFAFELPFLPRPREVRMFLRSFELRQEPYGILLIEDISEQKSLEREKENLLSVLMHDLNNPLQGILGYASLLQDGAMGPLASAEQRRAMRAIRESSSTMRRLIQGTLQEMRGAQRRRREANLHALVLSSIGGLLPTARARDVTVYYDGGALRRAEFPRRAVVVRGLVDQLGSLVQNLLANGIKYASSEVHIELREERGAAILEVRDDGPGIAPAEQTAIFARGYQAPDSEPGHGLGLYSVERTVRTHGGEVQVESEPGAGALVRVILPSSLD